MLAHLLCFQSSNTGLPMLTRQFLLRLMFSTLTILVVAASPLDAAKPLHVYLLAGQSNMEGQGVVDLDHPQHYNGGRGILKNVMQQPGQRDRYKHIQDAEGNWVVRSDVWCRFQTRHELKAGPLSIGFAGYPGKHHIGPEFQFGHVVGDATRSPVLLIKTAWGGKSLYKDFRPPSSGGVVGPYYLQMLAEIRDALKSIPRDFPELAGYEPTLAGFVWFQGWNDAFAPADERTRYADHLVHLIQDLRREFKSPELPVVVGELGNLADQAGNNLKTIRAQQKKGATDPRVGRNVRFVPTTSFARPKEESPNVGHGHHWFGNAESYFLIGDALGRAMLQLRAARP